MATTTQQISINGKDIKIIFGNHLQEMIFNSITDGGLSGIKYTTFIIFYGHENWCFGNDCPVLVKRSEVYNWMEENYRDNNEKNLQAVVDLMDAYHQSEQFKKMKSVGEEAKKKLQTIHPAPSVGETFEPSQSESLESATGITIVLPVSNTTN